jgi:hypothetical protein
MGQIVNIFMISFPHSILLQLFEFCASTSSLPSSTSLLTKTSTPASAMVDQPAYAPDPGVVREAGRVVKQHARSLSLRLEILCVENF